MKTIKILFAFAILASLGLAGCGGPSSEDAAVNADKSKPGEKFPAGLSQSQSPGGAPPAESKPATVETGA